MSIDSPGDAARFSLGFMRFTGIANRSTAAQRYQSLIDTFVAAEELGFDHGWIGQHHLAETDGHVPSPQVLFAAIAQHTRRIHFGTAITALPLEAPLRLAEDAAVADVLSGGRIELGLGSGGVNASVFTAFAQDYEQRRSRFDSSLARLRAALSGQPLLSVPDGTPGKVLTGDAPSLRPKAPGLARRIWQAGSDQPRAAAAARAGDGLLLAPPSDPKTVQLPLANSYLDAWQAAWADTPDAPPPRLAIFRQIFPARDRRTALADLEAGTQSIRRSFATHRDPGRRVLSTMDTVDLLDALNVAYGHPDEVAEALMNDPVPPGVASHVVAMVSHDSSTLDEELERLQAVATQVGPAIGWWPQPAAIVPTDGVGRVTTLQNQ